MIDPWVIEEIKRREQEKLAQYEQIRLPIPELEPLPPEEKIEQKSDRGVVEIQLWG